MPQLQQRVDGNSIPLPFFTNSLKRIYIPLTDGLPSTSLLARSVVWIMVHCPTLRKAAFAFTMSTHEDFNFLSEFKSTFKGLSNVTQLALRVELVYDQSNNKTWWGTPGEQSKDWIGGNEKTESVWNLLQVRKRLSSWELSCPSNTIKDRIGDETEVYTNCLSSLQLSLGTIKHLRLLGIKFARYD